MDALFNLDHEVQRTDGIGTESYQDEIDEQNENMGNNVSRREDSELSPLIIGLERHGSI